MKKALMIIAIIAIIAIAGSLVYYYVFFKPEIAKAEIRLQEQKFESDKKEIEKKSAEEVLRKENLEKCLKEAEVWYLEGFKALGDTGAQIGTPIYEAAYKILNDRYQEKIDACNMKYGK
ncbi:MAG: hypothetical protein ACYDIA_14095 [Candidatus Humimicrobiaceae bacterium]